MRDLVSAERMVDTLRSFGLRLYVKDGVVHGRMPDGERVPYEARAWIDGLQTLNDAVAAYLTNEQVQIMESVPMEDFDKIREMLNSGRIVIHKIYYCKRTRLSDVYYHEVEQHG